MGVGMVLVVKEEDVDSVLSEIDDAYLIGKIKQGDKKAVLA